VKKTLHLPGIRGITAGRAAHVATPLLCSTP
jgi:hypothetical protein